MIKLRLSILTFILYALPSVAMADCGDTNKLLKDANLKRLQVVQTEQTENEEIVSLEYSGFLYKTNAKHEGRRAIAKIKKCHKLRFETTETLFSFNYKIFIRK